MIGLAVLLQLAGLMLLAMTMHATPKSLRIRSARLRPAVAGGRGLLLASAAVMAAAVGWSSLLLYWFGMLPLTAAIVLTMITRARPAR